MERIGEHRREIKGLDLLDLGIEHFDEMGHGKLLKLDGYES